MPVGTALAIGLTAASVAGSVGGAAIASKGANKAASTQAQAGLDAAGLQYKSGQEALDFQKQQYNNSLQAVSPYYMSGEGAIANLDNLLGIPVPNSPVINPANFAANGTFPGASPNIANPNANRDLPLNSPGRAGNKPVLNGVSGAVGKNGKVGTSTTVPSNTATLASLINPALGAKGSLEQGFDEKFQAPTADQARKTPGYEFQLQAGTDALNRSAAAKGGLLTGGTARDLQTFGEGLADSTYGETYNRSMQEFINRNNIFNTNQANKYNRLASMAGMGQVQANELANLGSTTSNNVSNLLLGTTAGINRSNQDAAAARASGYASNANIWGNAVGGIGGTAMNTMMLSKLFGGGGGVSPIAYGSIPGIQNADYVS